MTSPCVAVFCNGASGWVLLVTEGAGALLAGNTLAIVESASCITDTAGQTTVQALRGHNRVQVGASTLAYRGTLRVDHVGGTVSGCGGKDGESLINQTLMH